MIGSDGRVKIGLYLSIENSPWVDDMDCCVAATLGKVQRSPKPIAKPYVPPAKNRRS